MDKKKVAKIATWIIVPLMVAIFVLDIITVILGNKYSREYMPVENSTADINTDDKIHFLNTQNSDCILLESNGHFALIDSGEGNNNPRKKNYHDGFEEQVISYLKKVASDNNGKVYLDFILGTHYHYDHIGSFVSIINDNDITIGKAYFKEYNPDMDSRLELTKWGLPEEAEKIKNALSKNNIQLISEIPDNISFYDFNLKLLNTDYYQDLEGKGENSASIGIMVSDGKNSAFLASDITKTSGVEDKIIDEVEHCDLLKIGHHGYFGSSSMKFLDKISPDIAIVTNIQGKVYPNVKWNLTMHAKVPFYGTYDYNGIIANFTKENIVLTYNIQ